MTKMMRGVSINSRMMLRAGMPLWALELSARAMYALNDNLQRLRGYPYQHERYSRAHGRPLDLRYPRSYTEKLIRKKLMDRNPLLPVTTDKVLVRDHVSSVLGGEEGTAGLVPLLATSRVPDSVFPRSLPDLCMIKANHGSGMNMRYRKGELCDKDVLNKLWQWLSRPFGLKNQVWAYQPVRRRILVEEHLGDLTGKSPPDYKFYMFHGECALIRVIEGRGTTGKHSGSYDKNWNCLNVDINTQGTPDKPLPPPETLATMLKSAEALSRPFDAVRVDLYSVDGEVYFGELTHYPGAGYYRLDPPSFDYELGELWGDQSY